MIRILVASSNGPRTERVYAALRKAGYVVDGTSNHGEFDQRLGLKLYALVVTDQQSATLILNLRRGLTSNPLLLVLIEGVRAEGVKWLDAGADDFLLQPFHQAELLARVRALSRRTRELSDVDVPPVSKKYGTLPGDVGAALDRCQIPIGLQHLLGLLIANLGRVVTHEAIASQHERVGRVVSRNTMHVMALRLRRHIASNNLPFSLGCVRSLGYRLELTNRSKVTFRPAAERQNLACAE